MKRHRRDYEMMSDMNLTNLLDTAFVLLIAFIMASPSIRSGLNINLPEVSKQSQIVMPPQSEPLSISIQKSQLAGQSELVFLGEARVELRDLNAVIASKVRNTPPTQKLDVIIEMDRDARYDVLAKVLAILRSNNIDSVGLPMIPENLSEALATPAPTPSGGAAAVDKNKIAR